MITDNEWKNEDINEWVRHKFTHERLEPSSYILLCFVSLLGKVCRNHG